MPFVEWSCSYCTVDLISWSVHCTMNLQRPLPHEPTCSNWWGKSLVNVTRTHLKVCRAEVWRQKCAALSSRGSDGRIFAD
jgi:hypothetical protein